MKSNRAKLERARFLTGMVNGMKRVGVFAGGKPTTGSNDTDSEILEHIKTGAHLLPQNQPKIKIRSYKGKR